MQYNNCYSSSICLKVYIYLFPSLRTIPAGAFRSLVSLEMLVLDNNFLSTLSLSTLAGLGNLQVMLMGVITQSSTVLCFNICNNSAINSTNGN